jgi:glutathione S-transferase
MPTANLALLPDNPLSKIPTLVLDDGSSLYDSAVICEYLDSLHSGAQLFPAGGFARWSALRRQALGDGFLDLLLLWRYERQREQPSQAQLDAFSTKYKATMQYLEQEASALDATPFGIGHIAIGCSLSYLDFRFLHLDWRSAHPQIAGWHATFAERPSAKATQAVEG